MGSLNKLCGDHGKSSETTGIEVDFDCVSLTTGTFMRITAANITTGGYFLNFRGASSATVFSVSNLGTVACHNMDVGGTMTVAGASVMSGNVNMSDNIITNIGLTSTIGGSGLEDQQYLVERTRRYATYMNDFTEQRDYWHQNWTRQCRSGASLTPVIGDVALGVLPVVTSTTTTSAIQIQHKSESVKIRAGKKIWFEARVAMDEMTQSWAFVGLCITNAHSCSGTTGLPSNAADWIGFSKMDKSGKWHLTLGTGRASCLTSSSSRAVTTGVSDTYVRLGMLIQVVSGVTSATPYIDGVAGTAPTELTSATGTSYPYGTELAPTVCVNTTQNAAATLLVDYIEIVQER